MSDVRAKAVTFDFWNTLVLSEDVRVVLLAMPHHAGNANALYELRDRDFPGQIAAIVQHRDQIQPMRDAGADAVFHLYQMAGPTLADEAARVCGLEESGDTR
jgi:glutathione-regulated potassium-efflux system ancillary protein KefC